VRRVGKESVHDGRIQHEVRPEASCQRLHLNKTASTRLSLHDVIIATDFTVVERSVTNRHFAACSIFTCLAVCYGNSLCLSVRPVVCLSHSRHVSELDNYANLTYSKGDLNVRGTRLSKRHKNLFLSTHQQCRRPKMKPSSFNSQSR